MSLEWLFTSIELLIALSRDCYGLRCASSIASLFCFLVKNLPANVGDTGDVGSIPYLGRSPGVGNGNPLQYSCLENSMDRGAWWATVCGVAKSRI